jgi:hypothetical protein
MSAQPLGHSKILKYSAAEQRSKRCERRTTGEVLVFAASDA